MHFVEAPTNFYLGASVDKDTGQVIPDDIIYYDSRNLMTHGVILGMTGSGKTGLAISILEEAVIDGIPSLIIDPKGDITNMLLAFPDLSANSFKPWINPEDALRADASLEEHAEIVAEKWRTGLAEWGITNERIQEYRRAARFSIYTPGSEAGLQISILRSFAAPQIGWEGNEEMLRERISGTVTAILALIGVDAKPIEDREHVLLSNIFEYNWRNNSDLSMEQLILQVQHPPFSKLGVLDVESVFPEKNRFKLSQQLNNIIAAPNFQNWIVGEPIDIPNLLYTPEGYPRTTIFYTAHLNDSERQFILTLLLESVSSWMRSLDGTSSLRALLYMDEVYGLFPPHPYNPPTKAPILRLLKQARAFGLGVLLATQNPKDIDYKGLSNAGTWFIGKLQTDNDKDRVLEGLDSARDATSALDIHTVDSLIGRLGPRQFIMHDVHDPNTPRLMNTRWTMSYLRGPLTRQHISQLMANQRHLASKAPQQPQVKHASPSSGAQVHAPAAQSQGQGWGQGFNLDYPAPGSGAPASVPPTYSGTSDAGAGQPAGRPQVSPQTKPEKDEQPPEGFSPIPPGLPSSIYQYYLPTEYTVDQAIRNWESWTRQGAVNIEARQRLLYQPALLAQTNVLFQHKATNSSEMWTFAFVVPNLPRVPYLDWGEFATDPFDPYALDPDPYTDAFYAELPSNLSTAAGFKDLQGNLTDWIYQNAALYVYHNPVLKLYSSFGESKNDFYTTVQAVVRQKRDEEVDKVARQYDRKLETLEDRARKKAMRLDSKREEHEARKFEELLTAGESALQLLKGRSYYTLSRTSRMRRYTNTSENYLQLAEQELMEIAEDLEKTEADMERSLQAVQEKWSNVVRQIEEVRVNPYKKDINMVLFGIGWVPYWNTVINGMATVLPASSSGLSYVQDPGVGGGGAYGY